MAEPAETPGAGEALSTWLRHSPSCVTWAYRDLPCSCGLLNAIDRLEERGRQMEEALGEITRGCWRDDGDGVACRWCGGSATEVMPHVDSCPACIAGLARPFPPATEPAEEEHSG